MEDRVERRVCEFPGCDVLLPVDAPPGQRFHAGRCRTADWKRRQLRPTRTKRSGRQVSYAKAVRAVAEYLEDQWWLSESDADAQAAAILSAVLPERQREPR